MEEDEVTLNTDISDGAASGGSTNTSVSSVRSATGTGSSGTDNNGTATGTGVGSGAGSGSGTGTGSNIVLSSDIVAVVAGGMHTCALGDDGYVRCWGLNSQGQLGYNDTSMRGSTAGSMAALTEVNLGSGRTVKAMSAGNAFTCAILDNDKVKCWGANAAGQLGYDDTIVRGSSAGSMAALSTVNLGSGRTAKALATGYHHVCAILDNDTVKCWGENSQGQLGYDDQVNRGDTTGSMASLAVVDLGNSRTAKSIVAGQYHTCAILDNNTLKCWGKNNNGQLGYDDTTRRGHTAGSMAALGVVNVGAGRYATSLLAGESHTCAILDDSSLKCWGYGEYGQLGYDSIVDKGNAGGSMAALATVDLGAGRTAKSLMHGVSTSHTCVILDNDTVKCWGYNSHGQLGLDSMEHKGKTAGSMAALSTVDLGAGRHAIGLAGGLYHTCALLDNQRVRCWGSGSQLGYDTIKSKGRSAGTMSSLPAVNLGAGRTAKQVVSSYANTCVILDNDTLKCWGRNDYGQLGYDDALQRGHATGSMAALAAVDLGSGRTAKSVALSGTHTCAILDDDTLKCWGYNGFGQLGLDDTSNRGDTAGSMAALAAVDLGSGRTAKAIALGNTHTCAILDDNSVKCWGGGNAFGQLGSNDVANIGDTAGSMAALVAVDLGAGRTAKKIAAGYESTCAILDNDAVKCWGYNGQGQLGYDHTTNIGETAGSMAALGTVDLGSGHTAKSINMGVSHTCVILNNNAVKCWGANFFGELGYDDTTQRGHSAGSMAALGTANLGAGRTAKFLSVNGRVTCVGLDNNTLKCWGENSYGQLGLDAPGTRGDTAGSMASLTGINLGTGRSVATASSSPIATGNVSCAILDNASLKCWGDNSLGQLGLDNLQSWGFSDFLMATTPNTALLP